MAEQKSKKRLREAHARHQTQGLDPRKKMPAKVAKATDAEEDSDDDWGRWSASDALLVVRPPAAAAKQQKERRLPIGASRHVESWLSYN